VGEPYNPYAAPQASEDEPESARFADQFKDAAVGSRLTHLFVDNVVAGILIFVITLLTREQLGRSATILTFAIRPLYYICFESLLQQTPAKMMTRTRVITEDGRKPSPGQIIKRTLIRFIPFEAFTFLSADGSKWHDRWSKTRVVHFWPT
jgi:uncharacterized RDD family membrane protein YckC